MRRFMVQSHIDNGHYLVVLKPIESHFTFENLKEMLVSPCR